MGEELIEMYVAALNDRNAAALRGMLCNDIELTAPGGVSLQGPEQVMAFVSGWLQAFPDVHYELTQHVFTEEKAAFDAVMTGTHLGTLHTPGGDIPATGKSVRVPFAGVMTLKSGQFHHKRLYFDLLGLLTELGVLGGAGQLVEA